MEEFSTPKKSAANGEVKFEIGAIFNNPEEIWNCYLDHAKAKGFPPKKRTSKKNTNGIVRSVTYCCACAGFPKPTNKNPLKTGKSMKCGCLAKVTARLVTMSDVWEISSFVPEHNHFTSPSQNRFFARNRHMTAHQKQQVCVMDEAGIKTNKIYGALVEGVGGNHEDMTCSHKDCRNYIEEVRRKRLGQGDAPAIMKYFADMVNEDPNFYFDVEVDGEKHLKNVFWAHGRSREAYKEFGEVVTFDTTYLTNTYDMPFAPFVGVNHHGHSILFGCGLLANEKEESFVWLFTTWLKCMNEVPPNAIITDQDRAMQNAIGVVFPHARHRWCMWHVMKKIPEKFGKYTEYKKISYAMKKAVYDAQYPEEFVSLWGKMLTKFDLFDCEWLDGLYTERNRRIPCYNNGFWAGMSSTQRSESMNAFFGGFVHSKTSLKLFVEQYEIALKAKMEKELEANADLFLKSIGLVTPFKLEKQIQEVYTSTKFKEFQTELVGKMFCDVVEMDEESQLETDSEPEEEPVLGEQKDDVPPVQKLNYVVRETQIIEGFKKMLNFNVNFEGNHEDYEILCSCQTFEFKCIVCKHVLYVLCRNSIDRLPDKYISKRWRKDIRRSHTKMKLNFNSWNNSKPQRRYRDMCTKFSEIEDRIAANDEEYDAMDHWLVETMNSLQIVDSLPTNPSTSASDQEEEEEENDEDDDSEDEQDEEIKDPKSTKRKGRGRHLRLMAKRKKTAAEKLQAIAESFAPNQNFTADMMKLWGVYGQIRNSQIKKLGKKMNRGKESV